MTNLFKKPRPPAPAPDPRIEENLRKQEVQADQERVTEGRKIQSMLVAARGRGRGNLMASGVFGSSADRSTGGMQAKLGRNPSYGS